MESFVFNSFKQSLIEGRINKAEDWYVWPVNSKFITDYEAQLPYFKTSADFSAFNKTYKLEDGDWDSYWGNYQTTMYPVKYKYMTMQKTDVAMEPEYVTEDNFSFFVERNPSQSGLSALFFTDHGNPDFTAHATKTYDIDGNEKTVFKGFYFVKTSEELYWCANKVNGLNYDNTIKIVLGDNIGNVMTEGDPNRNTILSSSDLKSINYCIGSNPAQPFEGLFFGNGFKILNINLICGNDANGIIGYLGTSGVISTVDIVGMNVLTCDKKINLDHLISNGNDISVGLLCGKNNGKIEHVRFSGDVIVNNFVPTVYSMFNKTDDNTQGNTMSEAYLFYPDYYCYNNPGNIVPYIGYFNEGVFATYSGYNKADGNGLIHHYWNTITSEFELKNSTRYEGVTPTDWFYWLGQPEPSGNGYIMHYTAPENRKNVLFYDANIFAATNTQPALSVSDLGLLPNNGAQANSFQSIEFAQYMDKSIKLSQQNRQAYYVSPIIGTNNSNITDVNVIANVSTSGTFVGFIGGLAGKQTRGTITNSYIDIHSDDITTFENFSANGKDLTNIDSYSFYLRDSINTDTTHFLKKSIKNVGGIFGSLVVAGFGGNVMENCAATVLNGVTGLLMNDNSVIYKDGALEYDDYYFLNRYGGLAGMVEFNASNIADVWKTQEQLNMPGFRCIRAHKCLFEYNEQPAAFKREEYPGTTVYSIFTPNEVAIGLSASDAKNNMLGISSPLYPEIKPSYLLIPSIIETPFFNHGGSDFKNISTQYAYMKNGVITMQDRITYAPFAAGTPYLFFEAIYSDNNKVGLYTIDQQLASPVTNPNFWCINTEVDLPGVQNGVPYDAAANPSIPDVKKNYGYAGGIVDKFNCSGGLNFSLDIKDLASKLIYWDTNEPSYIFATDSKPFGNIFSTVTVPAAAEILPASARVVSNNGLIVAENMPCPEYVERMNLGDPTLSNTKAVAYTNNFVGSPKAISLYPYFGSDLALIANTSTTADLGTEDLDIINPDLYESVEFSAYFPSEDEITTHEGGFLNGHSHHLYFAVDTVSIKMKSEAMRYQPFTEVPITYDQVKQYYDIKVHIRANAGTYHGKDNTWISPTNFDEEGTVKLGDKFSNWNTYTASCGPSGFYFYIDATNQDDDSEYAWFIMPFNFIPYTYQSTYKANPPYNTFLGMYGKSTGGNTHDGKKSVDLTRSQIHLSMSAVKVNYNTYIFNGFEDAAQANPIWVVNQEPTNIVTADLTGYRWQDFGTPDNPNYQFIKAGTMSNPEPTLNPTEAESAYVHNNTTEYPEHYITAIDGLNYPAYSNYDSSPHLEMSALSWSNIPSANWNWQNPICDKYIDSDDGFSAYVYSMTGNAAHLPSNVAIIRNQDTPQYIVRTPWYHLDKKGYFINNLLNCNPVNDPGLVVTTETDIGWSWKPLRNARFTYSNPVYTGFTPEYMGTIKYNVNVSNAGIADENNFYKYTYEKLVVYSADIGKEGIKVPVNYASYQADRTGFWHANMANSFESPGEFNNDIDYHPNVFNIGKTLSPESILTMLKTQKNHEHTISGFSADDFEGLYVTRNSGANAEPVMYIDVGLGECNQGTSWSYDCESWRDWASGLFLKVE